MFNDFVHGLNQAVQCGYITAEQATETFKNLLIKEGLWIEGGK